MGIVHFLNVKEGDCTWIKHPSGHNTVIDVSNANEIEETLTEDFLANALFKSNNKPGNHNRKNYPVNPIEYLEEFDVKTIFRFILTHPDMDHMDGIDALFSKFEVLNFWDTDNSKKIDDDSQWGKYKKKDWDFYQKIRTFSDSPKALHLYAGSRGQYYNEDENGNLGADGLFLLAPTLDLVNEANKTGDYNDCSYVILYRTGNDRKIIFAGDSADKTWDYILENYKDEVTDVDVLIAPHHGRKSGGNDKYLDVLNPKLTLFGNAKSSDLDYNSWNNRGLDHITNNQTGCVILDTDNEDGIYVYVRYETFAIERYPDTYYSEKHKGWYIMTI